MKKYEIIFGAIKVPLDFIIIFFAFFISRQIRLIHDFVPGLNLPVQTIDTQSLSLFAFFGATLYITVLALHGMYLIKIFNSKIKEFLEILRYSFYFFIFFSVAIYLGKGIIYETEIPRLIILFTFIIGTTFIILERIFLNNMLYLFLKKGIISKRKLIIVCNKKSSEIIDIINDIKESNIYNILGYINKKEVEANNLEYLGKIKDIHKIFEAKKCDEILYIDSDFDKKDLVKLWELSRIYAVRYRYITNSFDITKTNTTLSLINKIPVIEIKNTSLDNWGKILKRLFDISSGVLGIVIFSPLMLITAILIKIEDPSGPVLYKNRRLGEKGNQFNLYKFRYIKWEFCIKDAYGVHEDKDKALKYEQELIEKHSSRKGPLYKIKNDPRKTKIGTFIEKYSIDEIPQFFNILIGNMSLVGPRPHQKREVEKYSIEQKRLLTIKPGITGMAQVNGREENDFKKEAELDIFYIENWSFLLDLKIILKTFSVIAGRIKK
ncbi:sugar transferase [Candidatus Gracilibacteria bacterium 28_42_T64]|nr:sugar transferase [Candidatus Gracilibacteria bacterium 28_42_T64]